MTTRYRVEYALKTHRRDQFIEWIKGLLAVPFVLHAQPTLAYEGNPEALVAMAQSARRRYTEVLRDVEQLVTDQIAHQDDSRRGPSKLKYLVPSLGVFFTPLALEEAFEYQDSRRHISSRRFVAPSFNDIRLVLNSAQILSVNRVGSLQLLTFDGDVTLYNDGESLTEGNLVIPRILKAMQQGVKVGIVTAAGYTEPYRYYERLHGLLHAIRAARLAKKLDMKEQQMVVIGGESNYLLTYDDSSAYHLRLVPKDKWMLAEMRDWTVEGIQALLDLAERTLQSCVSRLGMSATIVRKDCAVGIIPSNGPKARRFTREQLEETVLVTQQVLETSEVGRKIPFCAFNGGNDVFVDIGDKSWGVSCCQNYFGGIPGHQTLHVGDQFLSAGANDFKARNACTTAWIANQGETVDLLDEIIEHAGWGD